MPDPFVLPGPDVARATLETLVELSVRGAVLLMAALVAARLLRHRAAAVRHALWLSVMAALLVLPILSGLLPSWTVLPAVPGTDQPQRTRMTAVSGAPHPQIQASMQRPVDESSSLRVVDDRMLGTNTPVSTLAVRSVASLLDRARELTWTQWLLLAWIVGFLGVLFWQGAGHLAVFRLSRRARRAEEPGLVAAQARLVERLGIRRRVDLRLSARIESPLTWGGRRPLVLLPSSARDWNRDRIEYVLLHELVHVRRFDHATQSLMRLTCAVYWFNPLVWLAARHLRLEREQACDDEVILLGGTPSTYAQHLVEIARAPRGLPAPVPVAALAMARPSQLEGRIRAILDPNRTRTVMKSSHALLSLAAVTLLALPVATAAPQTRPQPEVAASPVSVEVEPVTAAVVPQPTAEPAIGAVVPQPEVVTAPVEPRHIDVEPAPVPEPSPAPVEADTLKNRARIIQAFIGALDDSEADVRRHALYALAEMDADEAVVPIVRVASNDASADVRRAALHALTEIDASAAIPVIRGQFEREDDPDMRRQMLYVIAESRDASMMQTVREALADGDPDVRKAALMAAAELDDEAAIPLIESALEDDEPSNRQAAIHALLDLANPETLSDRAISALVRAAQSEDADLRSNAVMALAETRSRAALPVVVKAVDDPDVDVRRFAVYALSELDGPEAGAALLRASRDADARVRRHAVHALAARDDEASLSALTAAVDDADPDVRKAALAGLVDRGGVVPSDALLRALDDDETEVRTMAIWALAEGAADPATAASASAGLARTIASDPSAEVRRAAIYALAEVGSEDAVDVLAKALQDESPEVRKAATQALAEIATHGN